LSGESWGFTCDECHYNPEKQAQDDFIRVARLNPTWRYSTRSFNLKYPERCRKCEREKKRFQRMNKRLGRIYDIAESLGDAKLLRPKLITFALPSIWTFDDSGENQILELKSKLSAARRILNEHGVLGGSYVVECTTRSIDDIGGVVYKHHAHIHMVAIAPYIHRSKLKSFCEILLPLGLGRINYEAPRGVGSRKKVARYISKYLTKDNRSCASFGIMRANAQKVQQSQDLE
jgi:hypothetical protein